MYGGSGYDDGGYGQYGYGGPYGDGGQYGYGPYGGYGYGPGGYPPPPPPPRRRNTLLSHALVAVLAAGVAAGVVLAASPGTSSSSSGSASGSPNQAPGQFPQGAPSGNGSVPSGAEQAVINKVKPGMVIINTNLQYSSQAGAGTGMVINPDGLVLTNNHVIEGSTQIRATVVSTGKVYKAKVVGYAKTRDVALIQLQGASGLHPVPLGDSSSVRPGTSVVALGNADGQGTITPASGQITGVNKTITANDPGSAISAETLHGMLRTNAGIVSGDSGGPLSDTSGKVIGMDTAGNNASMPGQPASTGFAIPISTAMSIARQIESGQASQEVTIGYPPFLGIFVAQGKSSNPQKQAQQQSQGVGGGFGGFGGSGGGSGGQGGSQSCYTSNSNLVLPTKIAPVASGSLVDGAICGSPAAKAGLTGGSVITAVNGQAVGAPSSLTSVLAGFHPGQTISVSWVSPSGHQSTSSIHLIAGPPQ